MAALPLDRALALGTADPYDLATPAALAAGAAAIAEDDARSRAASAAAPAASGDVATVAAPAAGGKLASFFRAQPNAAPGTASNAAALAVSDPALAVTLTVTCAAPSFARHPAPVPVFSLRAPAVSVFNSAPAAGHGPAAFAGALATPTALQQLDELIVGAILPDAREIAATFARRRGAGMAALALRALKHAGQAGASAGAGSGRGEIQASPAALDRLARASRRRALDEATQRRRVRPVNPLDGFAPGSSEDEEDDSDYLSDSSSIYEDGAGALAHNAVAAGQELRRRRLRRRLGPHADDDEDEMSSYASPERLQMRRGRGPASEDDDEDWEWEEDPASDPGASATGAAEEGEWVAGPDDVRVNTDGTVTVRKTQIWMPLLGGPPGRRRRRRRRHRRRVGPDGRALTDSEDDDDDEHPSGSRGGKRGDGRDALRSPGGTRLDSRGGLHSSGGGSGWGDTERARREERERVLDAYRQRREAAQEAALADEDTKRAQAQLKEASLKRRLEHVRKEMEQRVIERRQRNHDAEDRRARAAQRKRKDEERELERRCREIEIAAGLRPDPNKPLASNRRKRRRRNRHARESSADDSDSDADGDDNGEEDGGDGSSRRSRRARSMNVNSTDYSRVRAKVPSHVVDARPRSPG